VVFSCPAGRTITAERSKTVGTQLPWRAIVAIIVLTLINVTAFEAVHELKALTARTMIEISIIVVVTVIDSLINHRGDRSGMAVVLTP